MNNDRFEFDTAGNLRHFIADELRATVAPDNIASYQESQPDAPAAPAKPKKGAKSEEA
jgi:hypothetical protein